MWITATLVLILIALLLLRLAKWYLVDLKVLPAGPLPLPFYGNIIPRYVHPGLREWHAKLRRKYGDVFTIHQGGIPHVVVNGYEAVLEVLQPKNRELVVQSRGKGCGILSLLHEDKGLVWNDELYKQLRRISAESIKIHNEKASLHAADASEVKFQEWLAEFNLRAEPVDMTESLRGLVSYNICAMLFGETDHTSNQERFRRAMELHYQSLGSSTALDVAQKLPVLRRLPTINRAWKDFVKKKSKFQEFIKQELEDHRDDSSNLEGSSRDFMDTFIQSQVKTKLTDEDCQATIMQLMLAGLDAVHGTLMWLILYCVKFPQVQSNIQKELELYSDGVDGQITVNQVTAASLPYCNAVINEVLRISNVAFTTLPYQNSQKITVREQTIPQNSSIVINLTSIHHDPTLYPEPQKFKPERFLDNKGKVTKPKYFLPFSIGRRSCIGESFTRKTILQVISSVLHNYSLERVEGEDYSTEACQTFLSIPPPYKVRILSKR